jgi:cyclopropane-fatty-acyl-phospholipid synthase
MSAALRLAIDWTEQGLVPDPVIRAGIRRLLRLRLCAIQADDVEASNEHTRELIASMDRSPIVLPPERANEQHYEVPPELYAEVRGPHRNYSCCHWGPGLQTLEQTYDKANAARWWARWRIFSMACAELFGYEGGRQWWVSHYLFERPR